MTADDFALVQGDALTTLSTFGDKTFRCCVTSPPYYGLRDYGMAEQIGLERFPSEYVARLVQVLEEVRRVLTDDGTLWLNLGDSYARNGGSPGGGNRDLMHLGGKQQRMLKIPEGSGLKPKDLIGVPWLVVFALQAAGWYFRQDIIWAKPNPMPESVTDRFTRSHEYVFLLSKSERYYFNVEAVKEPAVGKNTHDLTGGSYAPPGQTPTKGRSSWKGSTFTKGKTAASQVGARGEDSRKNASARTDKGHSRMVVGFQDRWDAGGGSETRRKRDVWNISTEPYKGSHFAVMPTKLVEPCVLAGSEPGDIVLDPFCGSGTVGSVALRHGRSFVGVDLNPEYLELARQRITASQEAA